MANHLLLVDYENVPRVDLSALDESYRAIVFVGAAQQPRRAARDKATAHRFKRVNFQKISGVGKNALDFHIAFELGRIYETSRETICIVISRDKGFDPLLTHLNLSDLRCSRTGSIADLAVTCARCGKLSTLALHGGHWCANCGRFATPPDPKLLPSNQPTYLEPLSRATQGTTLECSWCDQPSPMGDGIYDDGEWMCGACVSQHAS